MYKEFYGFTTYPFSLTPDPRFLYLSKNHENCLRYLLYSLERGHGLTVLTGKIGTGKTLLLNTLVKSLDEKTHIAFLINSKLEFLDILLQIILVGQPQLAYILKLPELTQLSQRIGFNCQLLPIDYYETKGYIEKRLAV